jgi:hypothetical protein
MYHIFNFRLVCVMALNVEALILIVYSFCIGLYFWLLANLSIMMQMSCIFM